MAESIAQEVSSPRNASRTKTAAVSRILGLAHLPPAVLLTAAVVVRGHDIRYALVAWMIAGLAVAAAVVLGSHEACRKLLLLGTSLSLAVATPEAVLRLGGFEYRPGVRARTATGVWTWTALGKEATGLWREGALQPLPVEPDGHHILVLGDSVSQQGYPGRAQEILLRVLGEPIDVTNWSVGGYSSFQGRLLSQRLDPAHDIDWLVVAFGWNDHWRTERRTDARAFERSRHWRSRASDLLSSRLRLAQLVRRLRVHMNPANNGQTGRPLRVPPDDFLRFLEQIGERAEDLGAIPILMTLPSAHYLRPPRHLLQQGLISNLSEATLLHESYAELIRSVAGAHAWPLLDTLSSWNLISPAELSTRFTEDGIHLTEHGIDCLAADFADFLARLIGDSQGPRAGV